MYVNRLDAGESAFLNRDLETKLRDSKDVKFRKTACSYFDSVSF